MYAGVGTSKVFIVGVEGILTLLDERLVFENGLFLESMPSNELKPPIEAEFLIIQGPRVTNIFTGPKGKLNLFVKFNVPVIKTCKVKFFTFKCPGIKTVKETLNIYESPALFKFEDILWHYPLGLKLDVLILESGDPIYLEYKEGSL